MQIMMRCTGCDTVKRYPPEPNGWSRFNGLKLRHFTYHGVYCPSCARRIRKLIKAKQ